MNKLQKIAVITLTIGWFPFAFLSAYTYKRVESDSAIIIAFIGFAVCIISSSIVMLGVMSNRSLWLKDTEYEKELNNFMEAKKKYEQATLQIVKNQKV